MSREFFNYSSVPAAEAVVITPTDGVDLARPARSLYVGTTGNITLIPEGGIAAVLFTAVPVGFFPVRVKQVLATGTTASTIVALY